LRVGIDIGGTFTDMAVLDESTGEIQIAKSFSTPRNPVEGVVDCIRKSRVNPEKASYLVHGTTIATNAITQRTLPKTALVTTRGFRDILEIMRANRPLPLYDIQWDKPKPLVPRRLRFEVTERFDCRGQVVKKLDESEAISVIRHLKALRVEAIAVAFLFSYMNGSHEERFKELLKRIYPEAYVSVSSEVNAQIREYERTSTVVIDAVVKPLMDAYLRNLEHGLRSIGFKANLMIMRSSGGTMTSRSARQLPIHTIESGPAGGVVGGSFIGDIIGKRNLICIDMGGTTFKASIVDSGVPRSKMEGEVEWGIPYRIPMIDVHEIGTGGGSVAWIDKGGLLRVGPQSAGAEPGPVCYDRGGTEPTITDANAVLGRLDREYFLGGDVRLNTEKAERAIKEKIAVPLGMDVVEAANGILQISNANMYAGMRIVSVERGYDPRDFSVFAYGGAGPMVAATLAKELGSSEVVIPSHPGIFSAIGMLSADIRFDLVRTYMVRVQGADLNALNEAFSKLDSQVVDRVRTESSGRIRLFRTADMRYVGQNYEVTCSAPPEILDEKSLAILRRSFDSEHYRLYGHFKEDEPSEIVSIRSTAIASVRKPKLKKLNKKSSKMKKWKTRQVFFEKDFVEANVYRRSELLPGTVVDAPAVIEEADSTMPIEHNHRAVVDDYGNLVITVR
jgi:N-methylhydantoinase A